MSVRALLIVAWLPVAGIGALGDETRQGDPLALPPMTLPGPTVDTAKRGVPLRPPATGIDCTFGVACPIIWSPPKHESAAEPSGK